MELFLEQKIPVASGTLLLERGENKLSQVSNFVSVLITVVMVAVIDCTDGSKAEGDASLDWTVSGSSL